MIYPNWYGEEISKIMKMMSCDMDNAETVLQGRFRAIVRDTKCTPEDALIIYGQEILRCRESNDTMDEKNQDRDSAEREYDSFINK